MALFPSRDILLSFKAGKSYLQDKIVNSDARKGKLVFKRDKAGNLHLFWMNRDTGETEDDWFLTKDAEFFQIPCQDGRVIVLKFRWSNEKHFFWIQEPWSKMCDDELLIEQANELICFPQPPMTRLHETVLRKHFTSNEPDASENDFVTLRRIKREPSGEGPTIELKPMPKREKKKEPEKSEKESKDENKDENEK